MRETVRSEIPMPSIFNSPCIRGARHRGLATAIAGSVSEFRPRPQAFPDGTPSVVTIAPGIGETVRTANVRPCTAERRRVRHANRPKAVKDRSRTIYPIRSAELGCAFSTLNGISGARSDTSKGPFSPVRKTVPGRCSQRDADATSCCLHRKTGAECTTPRRSKHQPHAAGPRG